MLKSARAADRGMRFLQPYSSGLLPTPQSQALQTACLAIMAYYFESCDVFENPVLDSADKHSAASLSSALGLGSSYSKPLTRPRS